MDCRDSALFTGVDEVSCENMLRCFSAYEQRFSAGQTILTCGQQQDMIGVLLSGSAVLLRLHADGNRTVLERMDEGGVFGELSDGIDDVFRLDVRKKQTNEKIQQ